MWARDELDEAIIPHMRRTSDLLIGECRAEEITIALESADPARDDDQKMG
jgi:actin-like ATPase involved in cell morphogenesis